jgi:predicted Zn finger-like uncharacterized protein
MDVRCDRCQTEYELDDDAVAGAGASVQCTTCGHTFVVSRMPPIELRTTPAAGLPDTIASAAATAAAAAAQAEGRTRKSTPPPIPEWVLATESGQTHRLRDLTTLQKWIVERRVGRADRVSHRGGAWRTLGDVDELRAFFDVVEQADRQTGASRPAEPPRADPSRGPRSSSTVPATPRGIQSAASRGHVSAELPEDDTFSMREGRRGGRFEDRFPDTIPPDEDLSLLIKPKRTGLKVVGGVVFLGLAAGAWYLGFRDPHGFKLSSGAPVSPTAPVAAPAPAPVAVPPAAPVAAVPAAPAPVAVPPAAPVAAPAPAAVAPAPPAPAAVAAAPAPVAAAPAPVAAAPVAAAPVAAVAAPPGSAPDKAAHAAAAPADNKPRGYERLIADADHALENGQTAKAQKLYEDALKVQPNGVAAITGSAYVLMDKHRALAAIDLFRQALGNAPHFAPALFGLGEAYRMQGKPAQAIDAYKQYLDQSPTGTDAPAARRQIKELSDAPSAPPPHREGPSAVIPEGTTSSTSPPPAQ